MEEQRNNEVAGENIILSAKNRLKIAVPEFAALPPQPTKKGD